VSEYAGDAARSRIAQLTLNPKHKLTEDEYFEFCAANPDLRTERTAEGEIVIVPPAGGESSFRSGRVFAQLSIWAEKDGRGIEFESSAKFLLPDGSALSPDGAWVSNKALVGLTRKQRRQFPPVCPEFVVEVMSPSDRLRPAQAKMERWIANGVQLGWLIDGDAKTVYIYRPSRLAEKRSGILELAGEGPVEGFILYLGRIWAGL
jgi:Uma2 family endonuclease